MGGHSGRRGADWGRLESGRADKQMGGGHSDRQGDVRADRRTAGGIRTDEGVDWGAIFLFKG